MKKFFLQPQNVFRLSRPEALRMYVEHYQRNLTIYCGMCVSSYQTIAVFRNLSEMDSDM